MKRYYRVRAVKGEDGTHPDIPNGIGWVGNTDGEHYLVVTEEDLSGVSGVETLTEEEARKFLQNITDLPGEDCVEKWGVS